MNETTYVIVRYRNSRTGMHTDRIECDSPEHAERTAARYARMLNTVSVYVSPTVYATERTPLKFYKRDDKLVGQ